MMQWQECHVNRQKSKTKKNFQQDSLQQKNMLVINQVNTTIKRVNKLTKSGFDNTITTSLWHALTKV